jgi:hypothetical protein
MSEEIIKVLDELGKRFGIALDWSNQNIMPYLQELMRRFICYRNVTACIWTIISIAMTITGAVTIKFLNKWRKSDNYDKSYSSDDDLIAAMGYIFSIGIIMLGVGLIIGNLLGIAKNICMPEMVVYEYITNIQ